MVPQIPHHQQLKNFGTHSKVANGPKGRFNRESAKQEENLREYENPHGGDAVRATWKSARAGTIPQLQRTPFFSPGLYSTSREIPLRNSCLGIREGHDDDDDDDDDDEEQRKEGGDRKR
ncbi:unnamed protein product [Notodromas monacha]|uniref:Uncharacterized protein n=1 Tax=Notodromas monacha TaxID=399045 RepID=A0A7R9BP11_9CRUS|nr:unnamed protein product [Notodromas monacha]CAG0919017.1 unnamed protein product [Notodromas monacha]